METFFKDIYLHCNVPIFIVDVKDKGSFVFAGLNPACEKITGISSESVNGKVFIEVSEFTKTDAVLLRSYCSQCVASGESFNYQGLFKSEHREKWQTQLSPVPDEKGKVVRIIGSSVPVVAINREDGSQNAMNRYADIFATLSVAIFVIDVEQNGQYRIADANPAALKLLPLSKDKICGKTIDEIVPKEMIPKVKPYYQSCIGKRKSVDYIENFVAEGKQYVFHTNLYPVQNAQGRITQVISEVLDISEECQYASSLKAQGKMLLTIAENLPKTHLFIVEKDMTLSFIASREFGQREIDREAFAEYITKDLDQEQIDSIIQHYRKTFDGNEATFELLLANKIFLFKTIPLYEDFGEILRILVVMEDVTEFRTTMDALRESEELFRTLVEQAADTFVLIDNGKILNVNNAACRTLGYSREEMLSFSIFDIDPNAKEKDHARIYWKILVENKPIVFESEHRRKDGSRFPVEISLSKVELNGKELMLALARDISDRKQAEESLKRSEDLLMKSQEIGQVGSYILDIGGPDPKEQIWKSSPVMDKIFGIDAGYEHMGRNWLNLIVQRDEVEDYFNRQITNHQQFFNKEYQIVRPSDGEIRWIYGCGDFEYDNEGQCIRLVGTVQDITERKQTERLLQAQLDMALRLSAASKLDEICTLCVDIAIEITGMDSGTIYLLEESTGDFVLKYVHGLSDEFMKEEGRWLAGSSLVTNINAGLPIYLSTQQVDKILQPHQKLENLKGTVLIPIRHGGKIIGTLNIGSHIIDEIPVMNRSFLETLVLQMGSVITRSLTQDALRESQELFTKLIAAVPDIIVRTDINGDITFISEFGLEVSGYEWNDLLGQNMMFFIAPEYREKAIQYTIRMAETRLGPQEYTLLMKNGSALPVEVNGDVLRDESGKPYGFVYVCRDITERKKAEEQIKKDLKEKEILLRELYHRTKNNMQVISAMLRLKARSVSDSRLTDAFREVGSKILSMALVHQKLYDSKDLSHLNLKDYILSLVDLLQTSYRDLISNVDIRTKLSDVEVLIDTAVPVGLIVNELLTNAIKYAFPENQKGKIDIHLHIGRGKLLILEIIDNGVGLPENFNYEEDINIGLQTVFEIVRNQLNGRIDMVSNKGLSFRIALNEELYKPRV